MTYLIFQVTSEAMMDVLDDLYLVKIVRDRSNEAAVEVSIDDL